MTWRLGLAPFLAAAVVAVAATGCAREEPADPPTPEAAVLPADPSPPNTPLPTQTAEPEVAIAADTMRTATPGGVRPLPRRVVPGVDLHDTQVVTAPGSKRSTMAPWRDGGGNRLFSTHVFGTPFMLNEKGEPVPWIATAITSNEDMDIWTMKLREDAVFQDGTPITAADFKAYWEYGARPENSVAWGGGGASLTLEDIRGWAELNAGDVTQAEGLRVVDDHTLEIEVYRPVAAWAVYMAAWHVGISKLEQVRAEESTAVSYDERTENWGTAPIGAGPFSLIYDPETGLTELTRVDLVGMHWNGPNDRPIIERLVLPNIEDESARLLMFENGELDVMNIDRETYEAALNPDHPFNPMLYESPYGGLWYIEIRLTLTPPQVLPTVRLDSPSDDFWVRRALAHGVDMESIVRAIWGPAAIHAKGLISSHVPCHNPDANYQRYDPELARQHLSKSTYGSGPNVPLIMIDLDQPDMVAMGVAMKEYWKDNLGVELDVLKRESGMRRRPGSRFYQTNSVSWIPDPSQIGTYVHRLGFEWGRHNFPVVHALMDYARSLPLDHPDRCRAFQAVEEEILTNVSIIPIREVDPIRWVVQPWLRGFESTFNLDFNTLTTAYVARH